MSKPDETNKPTLPRVWSLNNLAAHLGLSRRTLNYALAAGDLDHYRVGTRALIPEASVIAWLESQRVSRRRVA
jgi:excisionase family DNA binding protein